MKHKVDEKGIIYVEQPHLPTLSLVISVFSLALISLGSLSIFALQKPLNEAQNTVSKASVNNGPVLITANQAPTPLYSNQLDTIDLNINTQGYQTQGVTAIFNVTTNVTDGLNVEPLTSANLKATSQEVQRTDSGFLIKVVAVPAGTGPFSSTTSIPFLRLTFTPHSTGNFQIDFDQVYSHVYLNGSNNKEELGMVPQMNFSVVTNTALGSSCNQACGKNSDCAVNLGCFNGVCRSASNPSSTNCNVTIATDKTCYQTCSTSAQCLTGLACFNNRCVNPQNPDSSVCAGITQITYNTVISSCNQNCSSNKDCAVNLRCYQGTCRLATNPSSLSCTPSDISTVTSIYSPATSVTGAAPVGSKGYVNPAASTSATTKTVAAGKTATSSGTLLTNTPFSWPTPVPVVTATPAPAPVYQTAVPPTSDSSNFFSDFLNKLRNQSSSANISFPLIAVIAGIVLLIMALLLLITKRKQTTSPATKPGVPSNPRPSTPEEKSLEQRIAELKAAQKPAAPTFATTTPISAVNTPVSNVATLPTNTLTQVQPTQPPTLSQPVPTVAPNQPIARPITLAVTQPVVQPIVAPVAPTVSQAPAQPKPAPATIQNTNSAPIQTQTSTEASVTLPPSSLTLQSAPIPANPVSSVSSSTMMQRLREKGVIGKISNPLAPPNK